MRSLLAVWKFLRGLWHVLVGMWTIYVRFPQLAPEQREMRVQAWALQFLALWGIHLRVLGQPVPNGPALMVANHISWLDILVMNAAHPSRFVSKADVKGWPLLGSLITGAGTLYIERESRRDAMRVVHHMAERLREGDTLTVFPEGTTGDGRTIEACCVSFDHGITQLMASCGQIVSSTIGCTSADSRAVPRQ